MTIMFESPLVPTLVQVSSRFAMELRELVRAVERGENIEPRLRVIREYSYTWCAVNDMITSTATRRVADLTLSPGGNSAP